MTTPPTPPPAAPEPHAQEVDRRLSGIETTLSALTASLHGRAQEHTEHRLERPQAVADQVEAALRQAEESRQRAEADREAKSFRETITQQVKELREKAPGPPVRPIEGMMWGRRA